LSNKPGRATEPGAIGSLLRREGLYSPHLVEPAAAPRRRRPLRLVAEARPQADPQPLAKENQKWKAHHP
jgi:hypothetical protein